MKNWKPRSETELLVARILILGMAFAGVLFMIFAPIQLPSISDDLNALRTIFFGGRVP